MYCHFLICKNLEKHVVAFFLLTRGCGFFINIFTHLYIINTYIYCIILYKHNCIVAMESSVPLPPPLSLLEPSQWLNGKNWSIRGYQFRGTRVIEPWYNDYYLYFFFFFFLPWKQGSGSMINPGVRGYGYLCYVYPGYRMV